jgi:hypothetical protein
MTTPENPVTDPPRRSLISVEPAPAWSGGGVLLGCDCGTTTHLIIEDAELLTEPREAAFTCDGCQTPSWFTVGPTPTSPSPAGEPGWRSA